MRGSLGTRLINHVSVDSRSRLASSPHLSPSPGLAGHTYTVPLVVMFVGLVLLLLLSKAGVASEIGDTAESSSSSSMPSVTVLICMYVL